MLRRAACKRWLNTFKAELAKIKLIDKDVNHAQST